MKLDGELAFYHSNISLEPESQSFKLDDNDLDSGRCRSGNQKVKENDKRVSIDLKRNGKDLDLLPYDMEAEDALATPELDSDIDMIDLKNDNEVQVKDFLEPVSHSSEDMGSFRKFPTAPFPDSPTVPIPNPREADSFKNPADIYMDKSVMECEPELIVCYKENNYHVIKDICVDEGVPAKDKMLFEDDVDEEAVFKLLPSEDYESKKLTKDNIGIDVAFPVLVDLPPSEESDKVSAYDCQFKDSMQKDEDPAAKPADNVDKEMLLPAYKTFLQELDEEQSIPLVDKGDKTEHNYEQVASKPELYTKPEESKDRVEETVSASPLALAEDESNGDMPVSDSTPSDPTAPASSAKEECQQVDGLKCDDTLNSSQPFDGKSDDQAVTSQARHSLGESSFSAVGHVSSHISYSDPVPYSGSISLRSDSSTTSTRSFAFPVLQSEWNSSPVRMAKANPRHYRKHRGWRQGLLCCRF